MVDKNQAIIDYLITCPAIQSNPLYFNFISAKDKSKQLITSANERVLDRTYIDGSVLKTYTATIIDFRAMAYKAVVKQLGYSDENIEDMWNVQDLINWISEQDELHNYPDFGDDCVVEEIRTTTENPVLDGIDTSTTPPLAQYSFTIEVKYLDTSKVIWGK